ncbi:hypothetical protein CMV30_04390 [Nibricoccus aquaticus]|uniref:DUF4129 domain-containing protein n=2 Tax=Nibricoccus aquaticus TaxID=2576891 RepID=A0A290QHA9_9BACT|nr:hypothetical protein CMV30_04390 [Nibricoccus aquaticus]
MELIEEAVHLLRCAPAGTLAVYYFGAGAWALGFLFFWAHTTWFAPSGAQLAWSSLGLVGLFVVLKVAQAEFCARLLAQRMGEAPPVWTRRRAWELAVAQTNVQTWGALLVPVAAVVTIPFAWVYGYFQHATVIAAGPELAKEARELSRRWPMQNHLALLFLSLVAFAVWINCASAFYLVPWLANTLLGLDNVFGLSGWAFWNTTFLASIGALAWLAVDPLVKAFYVLRVFHGRAQKSGEDLRAELRATGRGMKARGRTSVTGVVNVVIALMIFTGAPDAARAQAGTTTATLVEQTGRGEKATAVDPVALDRALDDVLKRRDFQWQLRPQPGEKKAGTEEAGPVKKFLKEGVQMIEEMVRSLQRTWQDFEAWLKDLFGGDKKDVAETPVKRGGGGADMGTLRIFLYLLIGALVIGIIVVIVMMVRSARRNTAPALIGRAITLAQPDLRDEATHAAQMPSDGWLALAKEQIAKGEWRLALRALYLATLAKHAADGLITLAKFKTNLDYERELRRRAVLQPEVTVRFLAHRLNFESVWYGRDVANEAVVRAWLEELERVAEEATLAGARGERL